MHHLGSFLFEASSRIWPTTTFLVIPISSQWCWQPISCLSTQLPQDMHHSLLLWTFFKLCGLVLNTITFFFFADNILISCLLLLHCQELWRIWDFFSLQTRVLILNCFMDAVRGQFTHMPMAGGGISSFRHWFWDLLPTGWARTHSRLHYGRGNLSLGNLNFTYWTMRKFAWPLFWKEMLS